MPITDLEYEKWLSMPNKDRAVLADLHHSDGVEYVASQPFISKPTDSAPNRAYDDLLQGKLEINGRIDSKLDLGALDLVDDGSITEWVSRLWRGYPIVLRLGSPDWSLDDFRVIANQTNAGILNSRRGRIQLGVYDSSALLQREIVRPDLPNGQPIPLIFGRVINAPATRISTSVLLYRASWLAVTSLIVKDGNGPVITHAQDYASGGFTAAAYSPRQLMCDVFEPNDTPTKIVDWVATHYGITLKSGLSLPDYRIGLRYESTVNGSQILDDVCTAIGGHWQINALGELVVTVFEPVGLVPDLVFELDDIQFTKIALTKTQEPLAQLTLQYARNYTPITEVAGSMTPEESERLRTEWLAVTGDNALTDYPLAQDNKIETALQDETDANTELSRRLSLKDRRHDYYTLTVLRAGLHDVVGKTVQINHPRLHDRIGRIISAKYSPLRDSAELEVWY